MLLCLGCFLPDETQIWPGDLRVVWGCVGSLCCFGEFDLLLSTQPLCDVQSFYFIAASLFLSTEPLSDIGQTEEKNSHEEQQTLAVH